MEADRIENLSKEEVEIRVRSALQLLLTRDGYLLAKDASERSITHRLAHYLQKQFLNWHVDCEYNRQNHDFSKKLKGLGYDQVSPTDGGEHSVFPDIIVHMRGSNENNLLAIEAKKTKAGNYDFSREEYRFGHLKLQELKNQLSYRYSMFILFGTRRERGEYEFEWI